MIKKLKPQLFNLYALLIICVVVPLVGFFVYATQFQTTFFVFISIALIVIILCLVSFHQRLTRTQSAISLEKEEFFERANLLRSEIENEWEIISSYHKKIIGYDRLKDITEKLGFCLSLTETSNTLSKEVSRLFPESGNTIILYLFHSKTGELGISSSQKGQMQINLKSKKGDLFDQWIIKNLQPLYVPDVKKDFRFDLEKFPIEEHRSIRSLISTPLMIGDKALGILRIDSPKEEVFTTEDLRVLTTVAGIGAVAVENAQLYEKIEDLAIKDGLTGLYLRRYLSDRMHEEIPREHRRGRGLIFMMLDLDYFKKYNDEFGHIAGDIVLKTIASILKEVFDGPGRIVSRYGGEEFAVLIPDCSKEDALIMAEEFRKKVAAAEIVLRRQTTRVTVSIGIASCPEDAKMKDELIEKADQALYQAKKKGRNQVVIYKS